MPRFLALVARQNEGKVKLGVICSLSIVCADREGVPWFAEVLLAQALRGVLAMLILAMCLVVLEQHVDLLDKQILHLRRVCKVDGLQVVQDLAIVRVGLGQEPS